MTKRTEGPGPSPMLACLQASGVPVAERRYGPGEGIYQRGDPDAGLCFLVGGTVRVYKPYGAFKEATVRALSGEGIFGEPFLDPTGSHRDSAEAASPCRVATVQKAALLDHLVRDPGCRYSMAVALAEWAEEREAAVTRMLARGVGARVALALLELAGRFGRRTERGLDVGVRLAHRDLASMVASERASVSTEMSRFQREGLIEAPQRQRLLVLDERGLGEVARGRSRGERRSPDVVEGGFPEGHPRAASNGRIVPKPVVPGYHGLHESGYGKKEPGHERSSSGCSAE